MSSTAQSLPRANLGEPLVKALRWPFRKRGVRPPKSLPLELQERFQELVAEYRLLAQGRQVPPTVAHVLTLEPALASLPDLFVLERGYAAALPDVFVPGAVQLWRARFRGIVGDAAFAEYLTTKPLDPGDAEVKIDRLRADLAWLIERVHYLCMVAPARQALQNRISWRLAILSGSIFCALGLYAIDKVHAAGAEMAALNILLAVVFFGILGGFISALIRVQAATGIDPLYKKLELYESQWIVMIMSPIEGGIFALLLYMIFAAGLLGSGAIFPGFTAQSGQSTIGAFLKGVLPDSGVSLARVFVWSFVAGFAERLVPDVLTRFAANDAFTGAKRA